MRSIRERRGLRQLDLARLAGYSVRLIGKAEAGKPLSTETIEVLAEALSNGEHQVTPADLMLNPMAIAEEYVKSKSIYKSDVVSHISHMIAPDFELNVVANFSLVPFQRKYAGIEGLQNYFRSFFTYFSTGVPADNDIAPCKIFEAQNEVVIWNELYWRPITSSNERETARMTTNLVFDDGFLRRQEDRIVITSC